MDQNERRAVWKADERVLANIGALLFSQPTRVTVRLSEETAAAARSAWLREDDEAGDDPGTETEEQRMVRQRAGALALIGAAVVERGRHGDGRHVGDVLVDLDAWFIGDALSAADDHGLISGSPPGDEMP